jgi:hypothetical protein
MKADDSSLQAAYILTWGLVPVSFYMIMATWWLLTGRTHDYCVYLMHKMVEFAMVGIFMGAFFISCLMFVKMYACMLNKHKQSNHITNAICVFSLFHNNNNPTNSPGAAFPQMLLFYFELTMVIVLNTMLSVMLKIVTKPKFENDRFYAVSKRTKALAAANDCPICLHEINKGKDYIQLPCKHVYHYDCMADYMMHLITERKVAEQVEDANHYIYTGQCGLCRENFDCLRVCKTDTTKTF